MAVARVSDPWGDKSSFENLTQKAASSVKQAVSDAAKAIVSDIKEQTGIEVGQGQQAQQAGQAPPSALQASEGQAAEQERQRNLNEIKSNLQRINQEIQQVRREKMQKQQQKNKEEKQEKQVKQQEEQKKNAEPLWKRFVRKGGSGEMAKKQGS